MLRFWLISGESWVLQRTWHTVYITLESMTLCPLCVSFVQTKGWKNQIQLITPTLHMVSVKSQRPPGRLYVAMEDLVSRQTSCLNWVGRFDNCLRAGVYSFSSGYREAILVSALEIISWSLFKSVPFQFESRTCWFHVLDFVITIHGNLLVMGLLTDFWPAQKKEEKSESSHFN